MGAVETILGALCRSPSGKSLGGQDGEDWLLEARIGKAAPTWQTPKEHRNIWQWNEWQLVL